MTQSTTKMGYIDLLKLNRFLPFLISQVLTNFGDGLFAVVIIYFAVKLNATATQLGIITFCMTLPRGLLGPIGGVIADKTDRRKLLIGIELARTLIILLIPVLSAMNLIDIWGLAFLGLVVSALFSMGAPAAKAFIPKLVSQIDLQIANSLAQAIVWPAYFIGAGMLSVVGENVAPANIFYLVALCFGLSLVALLFLPRDLPMVGTGKLTVSSFMRDLKLGYQTLSENSVLHARVVLYGLFTFAWRGILQILLPLYVLRQFGDKGTLYGTLMLVNGCGELLANLVVGKINFRRPLVQSFSGELLIGLAALLMVLSMQMTDPRIGLYVATFMVGVAASIIDIPIFTVIQREIPEQHLAKVISYWFTIGSLGGALGTLVCGRLLEHVSIAATGLVGGILLIGVGIGMMLWARRERGIVVGNQT